MMDDKKAPEEIQDDALDGAAGGHGASNQDGKENSINYRSLKGSIKGPEVKGMERVFDDE